MGAGMSADATIDMVTNGIALAALPFPLSAPAVGGMKYAAAIVNALIKGSAVASEHTIALRTLNTKMDQLSRVIQANNSSLRLLIVEHEFTRNVIIPVETMDQLMRDVMTYRTQGALNSFLNFCRPRSPYHLILDIKGRLTHDVTNPLITAMEADKLRTKTTFEIWKKTIHNLLGMLQLAQSLFEGLTCEDTSAQTMSTIQDVKSKLDNFIANYQPSYWPHCVQQLMQETADNYQHVGNQAKADILQRELSKIYTTHEFYAVVYNQCSGYEKHAFYGQAKCCDFQHLAQFRRGVCNIVVSRSLNVAHRTEAEKQQMSLHVVNCAKPANIVMESPDNSMLNSCIRIHNALWSCGFVGIIEKEQNPCLRWTGGAHLEPGRWSESERSRYSGWGSTALLIVGFS